MKKWLKILLVIVGVILLLGIYGYISLTSSKITKAEVSVQEGEVLVNGQIVKSKVLLEEGDKIETKQGSKASVVLYESVVITLEENTAITLTELLNKNPKVAQESGETWNQFTKLSGVEGYSISYGDNVASVRGTGFSLKKDKIMTGEGNVEYFAEGENFQVREGKVVEKKDGKYILRNMTPEEKAASIAHLENSINQIRELREKEIAKSPKIYSLAKSKLQMDDEEIKQKLIELDGNEVNLSEAANKSPIKSESLERIILMIENIRKIKNTVKNIQELN